MLGQKEKVAQASPIISSGAIAGFIPEGPGQPLVVYRVAGSNYLLLEYGDLVLDLNLRFRLHSLEATLVEMSIKGILELIPGVRSMLIRYDNLQLSLSRLVNILKIVEANLPSVEEMKISSRRVYLPIACHDRWTRGSVSKYMKSVRAEAPYLPDNVEFIARCNGLDSIEKAIEYFISSEHMVMGLGDVYLGAPCAVPLDPRRRLVVPKYNPARTWTPDGAVGIGGAFTCIYPMESPGGYQLIGRTVPIWNTWQTNSNFTDVPWLLQQFDRITFEPVSEDELEEAIQAMLSNKYALRIENDEFNIKEYNIFLQKVKSQVEVFKEKQDKAAQEATIGY